MSDPERATQRREELAGRVHDGEFDAAPRPGSNEEALTEGPQQYFALVADVARAQFDPAEHWQEFVQALWEQVDAGYGLTADDDDAAVSSTWFDHPDDPAVVAWDRRSHEG
jgi:hypothetical protein